MFCTYYLVGTDFTHRISTSLSLFLMVVMAVYVMQVTPNLYGNLVANTAAGIAGGTGVMPGGTCVAHFMFKLFFRKKVMRLTHFIVYFHFKFFLMNMALKF